MPSTHIPSTFLLSKQGMTLTISLSLLHADTTVVGLGLGLGGFWILGSINNWGKDEKRFDLGLQKRWEDTKIKSTYSSEQCTWIVTWTVMQMVTDARYFWWHLNRSGTFDEQSYYLVICGITAHSFPINVSRSLNGRGTFDVRSHYQVICGITAHSFPSKSICSVRVPKRMSFFLWEERGNWKWTEGISHFQLNLVLIKKKKKC